MNEPAFLPEGWFLFTGYRVNSHLPRWLGIPYPPPILQESPLPLFHPGFATDSGYNIFLCLKLGLISKIFAKKESIALFQSCQISPLFRKEVYPLWVRII